MLATAACVVITVLLVLVRSQESGYGEPIIGIDLGTTYSCVGIFKNGRVEIIPNDQGNRITPSYVSFSRTGDRLAGEAAKNQAVENPTQTLFDVKRLIGRHFDDETVKKDKLLLPYEIIQNGGKLMIQVYAPKRKLLAPEEVSAMILAKMRSTAENYLGREVKHAVITTPAYFTDSQRKATRDAGTIAGLSVERIINEPTAAAIAYGFDKKGKKSQNILVYDLGGGTFDVSVLALDQGVFEVLATHGDTHLGGEDFDQRIMSHFLKLFQQKYKKDASTDKRAVQKLRREVEKAKRALSSRTEAAVEIDGFFGGIDLSEKLTRAKFEDLNIDLFKKTIEPVNRVLKDSGLNLKEIDEIVLVGGSTRIPKIQQLLTDFFGGKKLHRSINPDEAVAFGATVQAGILSGASEHDLVLLDVVPLTLGIETQGGIFNKVVSRNTVIPTSKSREFSTSEGQKATTIRVFEGERPLVKDNHKLGEFQLSGFPKEHKRYPHDVTFSIDANGILKVTAVVKDTGSTKELVISNDEGRLNEKEIEKMVREAEEFEVEDKRTRARADSFVAVEGYLQSLIDSVDGTPAKKHFSERIGREDRLFVKEVVSESRDWIARQQAANTVSVPEIQEKYEEIQRAVAPIFSKLRSSGQREEDSEEDESDADFEL